MLSADPSLLGSLYKCLSSLLSIAFPLKASEQGLSGLHVSGAYRCSFRPVFQHQLCRFGSIRNSPPHFTAFTGANDNGRGPGSYGHNGIQCAARRVVPWN